VVERFGFYQSETGREGLGWISFPNYLCYFLVARFSLEMILDFIALVIGNPKPCILLKFDN
jgi:hypothetical protein